MEQKGAKDLLNVEGHHRQQREVFTASDTYDVTTKMILHPWVLYLPGYERTFAHKGAISGEA